MGFMGTLTAALYAVLAVYLGGWFMGQWIGDFALLTVGTTDGVMWGDSGVGQFLIHEDDLRRRDFSRVVYNWDCC